MNNPNVLHNCNGWNNVYSSVTVIGTNKEQVLHKMAMAYYGWDYIFFNCEQLSDNCIRFDASRECPETLVSVFSSIGPNVVCYASTHWDDSYFCVAKDNKDYENYSAEWVDGTPQKCDDIDDAWDCDVMITDIPSGVKISVGGGACTKQDYLKYKKIIDTHRV